MFKNSLLETKECVNQCRKLSELIEQECIDLNQCLRGDIYEAYKSILESEIALLQDIRRKLSECDDL